MDKYLLKMKRLKKGYKQCQIAEKIGISTKTYNHKENGKIDFYAKEIEKVAVELELDLEDINNIFFENIIAKKQVHMEIKNY